MTTSNRKKNIDIFDNDVIKNKGYIYTHSEQLSTKLSNERMSRGIAEIINLKSKTVLDLGCGDGTFSLSLADLGAKHVLGIDPATQAIQMAQEKALKNGYKNLLFDVGNIYDLKFNDNQFDVVVLRGVLHHLPDPERAIALAVKWGMEVVILEPNGMNIALKVIEKISAYHREHEEQSFLMPTLKKWIENANAKIEQHRYINFVPIFCHNYLARFFKKLEPFIEKTPVIRALSCGQYVLRVTK